MSVPEEVQRACDEAVSTTLALVEFLTEKKHSTGAIRAMSPYLTKDEAKKVIENGKEAAKRLAHDRRVARGERESGLVVPPGSV
jgi:hypothetical protein